MKKTTFIIGLLAVVLSTNMFVVSRQVSKENATALMYTALSNKKEANADDSWWQSFCNWVSNLFSEDEGKQTEQVTCSGFGGFSVSGRKSKTSSIGAEILRQSGLQGTGPISVSGIVLSIAAHIYLAGQVSASAGSGGYVDFSWTADGFNGRQFYRSWCDKGSNHVECTDLHDDPCNEYYNKEKDALMSL